MCEQNDNVQAQQHNFLSNSIHKAIHQWCNDQVESMNGKMDGDAKPLQQGRILTLDPRTT